MNSLKAQRNTTQEGSRKIERASSGQGQDMCHDIMFSTI